ncbi:AAA domain-containing protein [Micromonospora sp. PSH03]|uniref:DEAD/DEAH box helicase n=1 Tax=Micromonospora salmantinae TaxID=2911211 RepID=UPI001EE8BA3E|nr:AAA domain-containing protein [Micromonospora salmantinae]MCG5454617.1 AAA domain-containing protein [Micromonospora salmantinae]
MRADELTVGDTRLIRVHPVMGAVVPPWLKALAEKDRQDREIEVRVPAATAAYDLAVHHGRRYGPVRAQVTDPDARDWLAAAGHSVVAWVAHATDREVDLQCHGFAGADLGPRLEIGVDDRVAGQVRVAARVHSTGFDEVRNWLRREFCLPPPAEGARDRIVHSGGPREQSAGSAFTLHGTRWVADVALVDNVLRITRMTGADARGRSRWHRLSEVDVRFVDRGAEADASEAIRAALLGLESDGRTYLDLWQAYNNIEREALVEDAKRLRWARFQSCKVTARGDWRFELQPGERAARFLGTVAAYPGRLELEAAGELPPELAEKRGRATVGVHGEVRGAAVGNWTVDLAVAGDEPPPVTGYLFRSLSGDRSRLRRRDTARERIENDQAELPGLRLLIEGLPRPGAQPRADPAHDRAVNRVIGAAAGERPTEVQRAALRMALRTPDILLVQGPPGTGKTRFITDLLRCLDELGDRAVAVNRTLLSSVQHDAVDNVARRARRLGLPPTRVSNKPERDRQNTRQWRDETVAAVDRHLDRHRPEVAGWDRVVRLRQLAAAYSRHPVAGPDLTNLLTETKRLAGAELPAGLRSRLDRTLAELQVTGMLGRSLTDEERAAVARVVRSIRVTPVSFADDGPKRAGDALRLLTDVLDEPAQLLLGRAATGDADQAALLPDLAELRLALLDRLAAATGLLHTPQHDPAVEDLLIEVAEAVHQVHAASTDSAAEVLRAYQDDLREDLDLVERTLARYNAVLASTVQHADSREMSRVLDAPLPVFDTVVVDEAARANPLDLMIPMAFARRRIILVGDHKQLPHMLEQKVERELRRNRSLDGSELSQSLFERWFDLFASERPAVRTIRLDTQFRMHPALGRFVSSVFYGGPDVVQSHPSTQELTHDLSPWARKVAGWIDVPLGAGAEERTGFSRTRRVEAIRLVRELRELAARDGARQLTFGVITFYREQQVLLETELVDAGLAVLDDEGGFAPVPAMAYTAEPVPRQRLRVGTVDAFQGMEFDVVLLSVTRSSSPPRSTPDPAEAVRRYGHLLSDSRMCVAMSRQRRLLIAVGDAAMAERSATPETPGRPGRSVAEGLVAFRELCKGVDGGGIRR